MPDVVAPGWRDKHDIAITQLDQYLSTLFRSSQKLTVKELQQYPSRRLTTGWRIAAMFSDRVRRLDLLIDEGFPYIPPKLALVDRPPPLTWPHVEDDGVLCLLPGSTEISSTAPVEVTKNLLGLAADLVEQSIAGINQEDFRTEFLSYWDRAADAKAMKFRSLVSLTPPTRIIRVWRGRLFYLFSEDEPAALSWLQNFFQEEKAPSRTTDPAVLLWLDRPLHPQEYPRTATDVWALARDKTADGMAMLESVAINEPGSINVLLGAPTPYGPCLGGVSIFAPKGAALQRGFRPGKVPPTVLTQRYFGAQSVARSPVSRVDPVWVHGRGQDARQPLLRAAKVAILGCGSLGGPIALKLAQAGVGKLILIDPETLTWANIGRHPLGAGEVDRFKANALAAHVKANYPHLLSVEAHPYRWEDIARRELDVLTSCTLIVSAIGNWNAEGALNEWHLSQDRRPTIVYGWTEPHACAGHAVAVAAEGGCFQCGFTDSNRPLIQVTNWPTGEKYVQEPACGAVYQPYGPVELAYIEALIAELALDCILETVKTSQHRVWVARRSVLETAGGRWNPDWVQLIPDCEPGGFLHERYWPTKLSCPACQKTVST